MYIKPKLCNAKVDIVVKIIINCKCSVNKGYEEGLLLLFFMENATQKNDLSKNSNVYKSAMSLSGARENLHSTKKRMRNYTSHNAQLDDDWPHSNVMQQILVLFCANA